MHYCILYFSKEIPTYEEIHDVMRPFNDDEVYHSNDEEEKEEREIIYPAFMWDWFDIGGRYGGLLKLKIDMEDETYRWRFYESNPREGRLFHSQMIKKLQEGKTKPWLFNEEDCFDYCGYRDGFLYVDSAPLKDIMNLDEIRGWGYVDLEGEAHSREKWNGKDFIRNENYDEEVKKYIEEHMDCFVTILDIHD